MTPWEIAAVLVAGMGAGAINTVVGAGTLITFPTLLALGVPPVTANVSNKIGLVPGSVSGSIGYRRELYGQRARVMWLGAASLTGGLGGALLLLWLPESAFRAAIPVLIGLACAMVVVQPVLRRWLDTRRGKRRAGCRTVDRGRLGWLPAWVSATGLYGGYFGAAQGVLLMAVLGSGLDHDIQPLNAIKNVLAAVVNAVSALVFVMVAAVDWWVVLLIAAGSAAGGVLGALIGRRLSPALLRMVIVAVGVAALVFVVVA